MSTTTIARPVEPPVWRLAVASLFPHPVRPEVDRWIQRAPLALLVLAQMLLSLRLDNTAFEDESLYIQAGKDLVMHWLTNAPALDYGAFFSGAPGAYPVLAGLLDSLGGLRLVRAFSLACVVLTMLCVRATTRHLFGPKAGGLAAFVFAVTGPVVFVGAFATFDAPCLLFLSGALWLGVTRSSQTSAVLMGLSLAGATVVKYTGAAFIPVVLGVVLLTVERRAMGRQLARIFTAVVAMGTALSILYVQWGAEVQDGIEFTTTGREALSPAPLSQLLGYVVRDIGLSAALALAGGVLIARSLRTALLTLTFFAGASGLVLSQMHLGEAVSFEKHMAYSALFLAPLAGRALAAFSRPTLRGAVLVGFLWVLVVTGLASSYAMYQWPNVSRVAELVVEAPQPGKYFSTKSRSLSYYTLVEYPEIEWVEHYGLFDSGTETIQQAVEDQTYEVIIWSSGATGNPTEDARLEIFTEAVRESPHYELVTAPFPVQKWAPEEWFVYKLKD